MTKKKNGSVQDWSHMEDPSRPGLAASHAPVKKDYRPVPRQNDYWREDPDNWSTTGDRREEERRRALFLKILMAHDIGHVYYIKAQDMLHEMNKHKQTEKQQVDHFALEMLYEHFKAAGYNIRTHRDKRSDTLKYFTLSKSQMRVREQWVTGPQGERSRVYYKVDENGEDL